jgi:putative ABC transport system permease protein
VSGDAADRRRRPSSAGARWGTMLRSLAGSTGLLVRRRARRDAPLLIGWLALLCLAALTAVVVPRLVLDTVDHGARAAVTEVGAEADVVVRAQVGDPNVSADYTTLAQVAEIARLLPENLPDGLAVVSGAPSVSVLGPGIRLTRAPGDATTDPDAARVEAQFGLLGPDQLDGFTLVDGRLPAQSTDASEIEVVVSREAAEAASLTTGTVLDAPAPSVATDSPADAVTARVVGIVASDRPASATRCAPQWCDLPTMWAPDLQDSRTRGTVAQLTLLTTAEGLALVQPLSFDPLTASVRLPLHPERFTFALVTTVIDETDTLEANAGSLAAGVGATVDVRTDFPDAMRSYGDRAAASVAQMSLMIASLFGAVAAVMLLVSGLIVGRRSADLALERARGSSLGSVALRGLAESFVLAVVGVGAGIAVAALVMPGPFVDPLPLAVVCVIAILAPAVRAAVVAREAWSGRRQPANRRDRQQIAGRARVRRVVLEVTVVVLAVAALTSVRSRGLVEARTEGADPLLAAAPLLLAVALTIVVLRVQPLAVRAAAAIAVRSRGAVGVLAAAHAQRAVAVLPLLALTLSVGLLLTGSLMVQTVREGQVDASWQRIGADARAEGVVDESAADEARSRPGVTAASAQLVLTSVGVDSGAASALATMVAIDADFGSVAGLLPAGIAPDAAALDALTEAPTTDDSLPVLIDARLASRVDTERLVVVVDQDRITARVVGTFDGGPDGYLDAPFVYADLDTLTERLDEQLPASTLLVMGEGAAAAVASADDTTGVVSRAEWLAERRQQPLVQGVERMTQLSPPAGALAAIALITTVASGSRSRSRSLSLLRTLGVRRGFGWMLAVAELAPLVVAALLGGAVASAAILFTVAPAIGLRILAGGLAEPALSVDAWTVVLVVVGGLALCAAAIVVDVVAHRRDRPGDVLRVGETT